MQSHTRLLLISLFVVLAACLAACGPRASYVRERFPLQPADLPLLDQPETDFAAAPVPGHPTSTEGRSS